MSQQSREALIIANRVRLAGAEWKRETRALPRKEALERVAVAIETEDPVIQHLPLTAVLRSVRWFPYKEIARLIAQINWVTAEHRVRELSLRQRGLLADFIRSMARGL